MGNLCLYLIFQKAQLHKSTFFFPIMTSIQIQTHMTCLLEIPIMLKTKTCNLTGLNPRQLIDKGEEAHEMGGYFVINGIEKVVRWG